GNEGTITEDTEPYPERGDGAGNRPPQYLAPGSPWGTRHRRYDRFFGHVSLLGCTIGWLHDSWFG
ncbi:MAG TPA: hypothetical protein VKT80_06505, partial [Chloroflexota bacterium]|nr:hypothetical protein [Chloroflexota bacterium]